jgi:hypothetical protein
MHMTNSGVDGIDVSDRLHPRFVTIDGDLVTLRRHDGCVLHDLQHNIVQLRQCPLPVTYEEALMVTVALPKPAHRVSAKCSHAHIEVLDASLLQRQVIRACKNTPNA